MEIIIITGMSGAGKTSAVNIAQDNDYKSVDNLPPSLIKTYIDLIEKQNNSTNKIAFVIDIRLGEFLKDFEKEIKELKNDGHNVKIIFIDANDDEIMRRYQEKRRPHPYKDLTLENAIKKEREDLLSIRELTDFYIDTSSNNLIQLTNKLLEVLSCKNEIQLKVISFGYKHGILKEADYLFDTRFIDNPFYIKELKHKTGQDKEVRDYVLSFNGVDNFIDNIASLIEDVIPSFIKQSKNNIQIGIGCTGGQHRSVAIAERLNSIFAEKYDSKVFHREHQKWK